MNNILGEVNKQKRLKIIVKDTVPPYLPVCSTEVGFFVTGEPPNEWPSNHCFKMKTETNDEGLAIVNMSHEDDDIYPFYFLHLTVKKRGYLTTGIDYFDLLQASSQPIIIYLTEENNMNCDICGKDLTNKSVDFFGGKDPDTNDTPGIIVSCPDEHDIDRLILYGGETEEQKQRFLKKHRQAIGITLTSR